MDRVLTFVFVLTVGLVGAAVLRLTVLEATVTHMTAVGKAVREVVKAEGLR